MFHPIVIPGKHKSCVRPARPRTKGCFDPPSSLRPLYPVSAPQASGRWGSPPGPPTHTWPGTIVLCSPSLSWRHHPPTPLHTAAPPARQSREDRLPAIPPPSPSHAMVPAVARAPAWHAGSRCKYRALLTQTSRGGGSPEAFEGAPGAGGRGGPGGGGGELGGGYPRDSSCSRHTTHSPALFAFSF